MSKTELQWLQMMYLLVRYMCDGTHSRKSVLVTATFPTLFSFSRKLVFNKHTYSYMNTVNIRLVGAANNSVTSACKSHTFCQNIMMIQSRVLKGYEWTSFTVWFWLCKQTFLEKGDVYAIRWKKITCWFVHLSAL